MLSFLKHRQKESFILRIVAWIDFEKKKIFLIYSEEYNFEEKPYSYMRKKRKL